MIKLKNLHKKNSFIILKQIVLQLLTDLGKHHPQALVYPLTVACKSSNSARRSAANKILNKIREHSETLVTIRNVLILHLEVV